MLTENENEKAKENLFFQYLLFLSCNKSLIIVVITSFEIEVVSSVVDCLTANTPVEGCPKPPFTYEMNIV